MRIIGGRHKGRRLKAPKGKNTRPTSDAIREAVFNTLSHWDPSPIEGAIVLDLFAGTGALGLEALSRGARHVTFVDSDRDAAATIRENICLLGEEHNSRLITGDARRLPATSQSADLIFLDPPYGLGLLNDAVQSAAKNHWVGANSLFVMEMAVTDEALPPDDPSVMWARTYGQTKIVISTLEA